jgi:hypothetical protein
VRATRLSALTQFSPTFGLIEFIAYYYQEVMSAILEASRKGTKNLSVLRVEQCEDG